MPVADCVCGTLIHAHAQRNAHYMDERGPIMPLIPSSIQLCLLRSMVRGCLSPIDGGKCHNGRASAIEANTPHRHLLIPGEQRRQRAAVILCFWTRLWIRYFGSEVAAVDDVIRSMMFSLKAL